MRWTQYDSSGRSRTIGRWRRRSAGGLLDALSDAVEHSDFGSNGIIVRTALGMYAARTLTGSNGISVTNGDGVSGAPDIAASVTKSVVVNSGNLQLSNDATSPSGPGCYGVNLAGTKGWYTLSALGALLDSDFASTGLMVRTGAKAFTNRSVAAGTGIAVTNGSGVSGNPTVGIDKRLCHIGTFSYPSASSASTLYLYAGQAYGSGVGGHCIVMPWSGSIIAVTAQVNVTAYTSGNILWRLQYYRTGVGSGDISTADTQTITGTGSQQFYSATYSPGTYTFNAGDGITVRRDNTGTLTTDDLECSLWVQFDSPGA